MCWQCADMVWSLVGIRHKDCGNIMVKLLISWLWTCIIHSYHLISFYVHFKPIHISQIHYLSHVQSNYLFIDILVILSKYVYIHRKLHNSTLIVPLFYPSTNQHFVRFSTWALNSCNLLKTSSLVFIKKMHFCWEKSSMDIT